MALAVQSLRQYIFKFVNLVWKFNDGSGVANRKYRHLQISFIEIELEFFLFFFYFLQIDQNLNFASNNILSTTHCDCSK